MLNNEIKEKIMEKFKEEGINIKDCFLFSIENKTIIFEVDDEKESMNKYYDNKLYEKILEYTGHKIMIDSTLKSKDDDSVNILLLNYMTIRKMVLIRKIIHEYGYLSYLYKKMKTTDTKKKFLNYKRIEFILSNMLFYYRLKSNDEMTKFDFDYNRIFFDEASIKDRLLNIIDIGLEKSEIENIGKYENGFDEKIIQRMINFDPIILSKVQFVSISNSDKYSFGDAINEDDYTLLSRKTEKILEGEETRGNLYVDSDVTRYSVQLEEYLINNDIYAREFKIFKNMNDFNNLINRNLDFFIHKNNGMYFKVFIEKTFFLKRKWKWTLLDSICDIMKYIDSEYKKIIKPIIFTVEDFLVNVLYNSILELINSERKFVNESGNWGIRLENIVNHDSNHNGNFNYRNYINLIFKVIQKDENKNFNKIVESREYMENSWEINKYFFDSENKFINDSFYNQRNYESIRENWKILDYYIESIRFKFDLSFIFRKLSFGSLIKVIEILDMKKINAFSKDGNKYILLLKEILETFDISDLNMITAIRNFASHQDLIVNTIKHEVTIYEDILKKFIKIIKDNWREQSYRFQGSDIDSDIEKRLLDGIDGIKKSFIEERPNLKNKIDGVVNTFVKDYYKDIFGRDIFERYIDQPNIFDDFIEDID